MNGWVPTTAYDKKNAENTDGKAVGHDSPQRLDVLPGSWKRKEGWGFATWKLGFMTGRGRELADEMEERNIDVMCIQETSGEVTLLEN